MNTLMKTFDPFWSYNHTASFTNKWEIKDNAVHIEVTLPGIDKGDVELKFCADREIINIFVKDKIDKDIILYRQIDPEKIEAELSLGVLRIRAPLKNQDRKIEIK